MTAWNTKVAQTVFDPQLPLQKNGAGHQPEEPGQVSIPSGISITVTTTVYARIIMIITRNSLIDVLGNNR
jgi:hypothetical protein